LNVAFAQRVDRADAAPEKPNAYQHFPAEVRPVLYLSMKSCSNYRPQAEPNIGQFREESA
jgi:hypothetical protein